MPQETSFTLADGTVIELRAMNVGDFTWMQNKFGTAMKEKLSSSNFEQVVVVLYRLLKDKDKYAPTEVNEHDDEGNKVTVKLTGPQVLARKISGFADLGKAMDAFTKAMGLNDSSKDETAGEGATKE